MSKIGLSLDLKKSKRIELNDPARVEVLDDAGDWLATYTLGAYTVALKGPSRSFWEPSAAHPLSHEIWIRTLPQPFGGAVDQTWLALALGANFQETDDVLAIAMQYVDGAPDVLDGKLRVGGAAFYGPLKEGKREEGSDFNDYLGITWVYPDGKTDRPESRQKDCLDCSGYMRMVWGYRHHLPFAGVRSGIPLSLDELADSSAMPRRAVQICASAPGVLVIPNAGVRVPASDLDKVQVGDLVFFDADSGDGTAVDHVGMFMGKDEGGQLRFISSRKTANAPTLGDNGGKSILTGNGLYAKAFRAVRRL